MNAQQILAILDRATVDGNLAADCRRLMSQESMAIRARLDKLDEAQGLMRAAKRDDEAAPKASPGIRRELVERVASTREAEQLAAAALQAAIVEAERIAVLWRVID